MKNIKRKLSSAILCALFSTMQLTYAVDFPFNTGLGGANGAVINGYEGGLVDVTKGTNSADLNFNANTHVKWDTLNVNNGETLNFNAVNGANNLTILNTVNSNMSNIYGTINANEGIAKLIIANPNGVLFDGANFTALGDVMLTTQDMSTANINDLNSGKYTQLYNNKGKLIPVSINNSTFNIGGEYSVVAAGINAASSSINAKTLKLITANGQDYLALGATAPTKDDVVTRLKAMTINGDLYITNEVGALEILEGGTISGNMKTLTSGNVILNKDHNDNMLVINGNADIKGNGAQMFLRNSKVTGDLEMLNGGGFLDVANTHITKNATLKTTNVSTNQLNCKDVKHFTHVIGDTNVDGNLTINSFDNIHIGGYDYDTKQLIDGKLNVGGVLSAYSENGHITTTIDTTANKISMNSNKLSILSDDKTVLKANEYDFKANGFIGGINDNSNYTKDERIIAIMENYVPINEEPGTNTYITIDGGKITNIDTPTNASSYIASKNNLELTGANAGKVYLTSYNNDITISGDKVHANEINVGGETDKLKVEFPSRDYTLKYTNIRDAKEVVINGNDEVTYDLTNGENGYNINSSRPNKTTYLVGPDKPINPITPTPPINPTQPDLNDDNENVKVLKGFERPEAVDRVQPYTPIAYAADLEDDEAYAPIRKNVDGSVTVVRAFPMVN